MITPRTPERDAEGGFTLVEMLIAVLLGLIVMGVIAGLFASAARTQTSVRTSTQAADLGQLIARSVSQGANNATALSVLTDSVTGAEMLRARVYSMSPTNDPTQGLASGVSCQAWYYSPATGGAIYVKTVTPAAAIPMPTGVPDNSWILIGNGLGVKVGASPSSAIFATPSGTRVDLKFDVTNGTNSPVHIETTTHIPNTTTVSAPCF
ncbi:hypothetical protein G3T36_01320 [Diaminobutyricibacter tongyongensis]|uniref:Prepilin-type N-terminal cleavage/methylation domain-containing protein n=1 Tax=Leifsonia tongyongensis TaxID=1268043 RepID=A0A6L9XSX0_9MICO|nr:prepilin-type N-terminal cleavage/methylation domain-containing protein [Diaminobutyricibacter tongyongensis]NEN04502.1 hypothetical protein [Diaminobutyricibacter tongyongensis]